VGGQGVRPDYPTLRKEREGWGTRQLVEGMEPKARSFHHFTCRQQASLLKSETWATHSMSGGRSFIFERVSTIWGN
jgi:hypothetical protein